jgi:hypothetical protein
VFLTATEEGRQQDSIPIPVDLLVYGIFNDAFSPNKRTVGKLRSKRNVEGSGRGLS